IFLPEFLRFDSTNFLEGYKAFNISFVPMLGVVFLVVCGLLLAFKRSRIILVACFVFLLLYQSRFLIDIVPATTKDVTDWKQDRTVPSFGNLVGVAEFLNKESEEYSGEIRIAMCGTLVTPLRYFIHPIQIEGDEWFPTATHGVLLGGWMQDGDTFICKNQSRKGELLHSFPDGSAVVRFFSES
ncbi:MAG: hypothetical protein QF442_03515, partial [Candidatus Peribacteraceae bacterium]|nr:hypothetical protein [Candidatus Peribacteraceae bacterium]